MHCWICGKEHLKKDCLSYQDGRPQIYSAHEVQIVGDVGQSIPQSYILLDNKQANHEESIIEMEHKLCDQVVSILIDPGSNYSYVNPHLVDKCGLRKEVHVESWLVQFTIGTKKSVHHWVCT